MDGLTWVCNGPDHMGSMHNSTTEVACFYDEKTGMND